MRQRLYLDEEHNWYELPLVEAPVGNGLPDGLRLVRAQEEDAELAAPMQGSVERIVELLREGHDLWLVCEGDHCAFSCWTFQGQTPVLAARGGWMALPADIVCLEDSATDADFRGRGIAPAAWREIARTLRAEGARTIVTKIATDNVPSQKAVAKAGFCEIGTMRVKRVMARSRVELVNGAPIAPTMDALAESLCR